MFSRSIFRIKPFILLISLALNGFFIGSFVLRKLPYSKPPTKPFIHSMPYNRKHGLYPYIRRDIYQARPLMKEVYQARREAFSGFLQIPFDENKTRKALQRARRKQTELWKHGDEALLKTFKGLSEEDRRSFRENLHKKKKLHKGRRHQKEKNLPKQQ